jgi:hypothetical protein
VCQPAAVPKESNCSGQGQYAINAFCFGYDSGGFTTGELIIFEGAHRLAMAQDSITGGGEVVLYEAPNGEVRLDVRLERDTVWLSLDQIAKLFGRDKSVISRHLRNFFLTRELERKSVVAKNATTAADGKTYQVDYFNLDAILSVGYRVNSKRGTQFRIWATQTLKDHLLRGYTLNEKRLREKGIGEIEQAVGLLARTLTQNALVTDEGRAVLEVVQQYTRAWKLLLEYDEGRLAETPVKPVKPTAGLSLDDARTVKHPTNCMSQD